MSGFLKQLKRNEPPSPPYVPLPLECPKYPFTTHERSKLKKHIESQHSPNYAPRSPKTQTYIETMPVFICNVPGCHYYAHQLRILKQHKQSIHKSNYAPRSPELVKCPYCKEKVSNINEHIRSNHKEDDERELTSGYRPPASPSPKGGKRKTQRRCRSRRITKRKTQRHK